MRKKKSKTINVVKLTEKERKKYTKKYQCKRCHDFFVDTKEELEYHQERLHGEYSPLKHQQNKKGNRKLKKLYLNRNLYAKEEKSKVPEERKIRKKKPKDCFAYRCSNCKHVGIIYGDIKKKLQNLILCEMGIDKNGKSYGCGCNVFKDNRLKLIEYLKKLHENDMEIRDLLHLGIDIRKFNMEKEIKKALSISTNGALEKFMDRRNGKK